MPIVIDGFGLPYNSKRTKNCFYESGGISFLQNTTAELKTVDETDIDGQDLPINYPFKFVGSSKSSSLK